MTKEEAIAKLTNMMNHCYPNEDYKMAIKALEQESKTDTLDRIKAEMHENAEKHEDGDWYLREEWVDEIIDKYKAETE